MTWTVGITRKAQKQRNALPRQVRDILVLLLRELEDKGPIRGNWPNYGKLSESKHHCHIKQGKPCYVAIWEVTDTSKKPIDMQLDTSLQIQAAELSSP